MLAQIKAVINKDRYQTNIEADNNSILSDEKSDAGGGNKGFTPFELLASSLASCTCITLRMYIDKKQWVIDGIEVHVTITKDEANESTHFERTITFKGSIADEHREKLLAIANLCPIHKTLSKSIYINTLIR
jgi:putative redox protein